MSEKRRRQEEEKEECREEKMESKWNKINNNDN